MQAALIIMTILGCDDSATQCHYVEMRDERWATVQSCDAASEDRLRTYSNLDYPVVVAVCQTPGDTGLAELVDEPAQGPALAETAPAGTRSRQTCRFRRPTSRRRTRSILLARRQPYCRSRSLSLIPA